MGMQDRLSLTLSSVLLQNIMYFSLRPVQQLYGISEAADTIKICNKERYYIHGLFAILTSVRQRRGVGVVRGIVEVDDRMGCGNRISRDQFPFFFFFSRLRFTTSYSVPKNHRIEDTGRREDV